MSIERETGYDRISFARGTEREIRDNIDKMTVYEPAIATDVDKIIFKREDGSLREIGIGKDTEAELDKKTDKGTYQGAADTLLPKAGGTMTGYLNIETSGWPSLILKNTDSAFQKQVRIENSKENKFRIMKQTYSGTTDTALDWNMSTGGTIYHTGNKPSTSDIGAVNKAGDTMTGVLTANGGITVASDTTIQFSRNTDYFQMGFKNTADGDTDSYGYIRMGDNGNEYFKFLSRNGSTDTEVVSIKSDGLREKGNLVYHTGRKPSANDVGALRAADVSPLSQDAGWAVIARVNMPQNASTVKIEILGGAGYNVGSSAQTALDEIIIRSGNNNPKGITVVMYSLCGASSNITEIGWKAVSGDQYDIYAKVGNYARTGIMCQYYHSTNATVSLSNNPTNLGSSTPSGITAGKIVKNYHSDRPPRSGQRTTDLYVGDLSTGNFTLSQSFYDFDYVVFVTATDDNGRYASKLFFRDELEFMRTTYNKVELVCANWYWTASIGSDRKTFTMISENSRIRRVYGGNY